jgi:glycerol-3-phosphate dehydrogenase
VNICRLEATNLQYDALSQFSCPPSHIMTKSRSMRKFPQLANNDIKYSCVFYEGQHDDARTNLAIALTAEREGCDLLNYCEVIEFIKDSKPNSNKVVGVVVKDKLTGEKLPVYAKSVLLCGGPFTDSVRKLAADDSSTFQKAVMGASGMLAVNSCGAQACL